MKFDSKPSPRLSDDSPGRKSIRLKGYDYCVGGFMPPTRYAAGMKPAARQSGGYFITIVTQLRESFFGEISAGEMILNDAGRMVSTEWSSLHERFPNIETDVFQIMPNHFHGIVFIHDNETVGAGLVPAPGLAAPVQDAPEMPPPVGAGLVPALNAAVLPARDSRTIRATTRVAPTLGEIVGAFKSITTYKYIQGVDQFAWPIFYKRLWQRNFYEHILRDQADYERIAGYILDNPLNWNQDDENPQNRKG